MSEKSISCNVEELKKLDIPKMIEKGYELCLIQVAIDAGADIHIRNDEAIGAAMKRVTSIEILNILKEAGMKFDTKVAKQYAIYALKNNYISDAAFLIKNGADVCWREIAYIADNRMKHDSDYLGIIKLTFDKMGIKIS